METLPSPSLPTFQVHKPTKHNHHTHIKPPLSHHNNHHTATTRTTLQPPLSTLPQKDSSTPLNYFHYPKHPSSRTKTHFYPTTQTRAETGYASALLEKCQSNGTVLKVERDVRRLLKVLGHGHVKEFMMDGMMKESEKGKVVKEMLDKGKFDKGFVGLVKLVIDKGKNVEFVKDVLEEFLRVFTLLCVDNVSTPVFGMGNV